MIVGKKSPQPALSGSVHLGVSVCHPLLNARGRVGPSLFLSLYVHHVDQNGQAACSGSARLTSRPSDPASASALEARDPEPGAREAVLPREEVLDLSIQVEWAD